MKKQKQKPTPNAAKSRARNAARATAEDYRRHAVPEPTQRDALESALGVAAQIAEPYPEEAESIDNVIRFVRDFRTGRPARVELADVLLALSIILSASDRDLTPEERDLFALLDAAAGVPMRAHALGGTGAAPSRADDAIELPRRGRVASRLPTRRARLPYIQFAA